MITFVQSFVPPLHLRKPGIPCYRDQGLEFLKAVGVCFTPRNCSDYFLCCSDDTQKHEEVSKKDSPGTNEALLQPFQNYGALLILGLQTDYYQ